MKNTPLLNQAHLLHRMTCRIHASLHAPEVHQTLVRELCCAMEGDCAGLMLYSKKAQTVTIVATFCRTRLEHIQSQESLVGLPLQLGLEHGQENLHHRRDPWIAQNIQTLELSETERLLLLATELHSLLLVPIMDQDQLLGMAYVGQETSCRLWREEEIELAKWMAEQAAIALHNARSYAKAQQQALREQALNRIAQRVRTSLDVDTTIDTTLIELQALVRADFTLFAVPSDSMALNLRVTHRAANQVCHLSPNAVQPIRRTQLPAFLPSVIDIGSKIGSKIDLGQTQLKQMPPPGTTRAIIVANTQSNEISEAERATFLQQEIGAWLAVPIWHEDMLLGYLITICQEPCAWTVEEQVSIEEMAKQLAIAIPHRQFYAATQEQATQAQDQAGRLARTLKRLYATQTQLIQSEKMASLGQMVAGIAHEINNPINFIYGNIPYAVQHAQHLLQLIKLYRHHFPDVPAEIAEYENQIELDFVQSDLQKILNSMRTGAERIRTIITTLRNFSRLDESEKKVVNLHEGLESTLLLLKHRLHPQIQVSRQYDELPPIDSYPGQLNQVFLNLLNNAIDAVYTSGRSPDSPTASAPIGKITIATVFLADSNHRKSRVQVRIRDTGSGISPQHQARIFDPFFTTKPVGAGSGLGLSISYRIVVHKHQGKLWYEPTADGGTEFVVELPVHQS